MARSLPPAYFDELYGKAADPWKFESSPYESAKFAATLAALPRARYGPAFEVGCSIGVLTTQLAPRCDRLLAVDVAQAALARARQACAGWPNVGFARMRVPDQWPEGQFDLILLSEVLYYLDSTEIDRAATSVLRTLKPGGVALLVHWTGPTDYPCSGDETAERFIAATAGTLKPVSQVRRAKYRLDRLDRG